ncbi:MAG: methionine synthase, partial [Proteobacteria bacterium]|nr:methionine synthase [Pseudomonadota bacterium]
IIAEKRFTLGAVYGYFPARTRNHEDVVLETPAGELKFHFLRQQKEKVGEQTYYSLADFIAPEESGARDLLGAFCVTAGSSVETFAREFLKDHDDYSSIIVKALGDRLAEAAAEWLHKKVRTETGVQESLSIQQMIEEEYRGIRPALGYPACPDHSEKTTLWSLLRADEAIAVTLTGSFAMTPPSSVSGLYFLNPEARYFNVGQIGEDQLSDYAARKGIPVSKARELLSPHL